MKKNMDKQQYVTPFVRVEFWDTTELMIISTVSDLDGPGTTPAPARRPGHGGSEAPVF